MSTVKEATKDELQEVSQIGKRLRSYLVHKNITFAEAATILEVSPSMITRLAEGVNMTVDILERIMNTFSDLNYFWLISGEGVMERNNHARSGLEYLDREATRKEKEKLAELKAEYEEIPAWEHGPVTEEAVMLLQAFMDEAMYLDRLGLIIQQRANDLVLKVERLEQERARKWGNQ